MLGFINVSVIVCDFVYYYQTAERRDGGGMEGEKGWEGEGEGVE